MPPCANAGEPVAQSDGGPRGSNFTITVRYSNTEGVAPAAGYPKVVLKAPSGAITDFEMAKPGGTLNYVTGVVYTYTGPLNETGTYSYRVEAKDGASLWAYLPGPDSAGWESGPVVYNNAPTLTNATVTPTTGLTNTVFTYRVTYTDLDNDARTPRACC